MSNGDMDFFGDLLPRREHYRIALTVPEQTAFLDIETTGLSRYYDQITVIGCSVGGEYWAYIKGANRKALKKSLSSAKCLVTFNGTIFDLKFIAQEFPEIELPRSHVDLRFFGNRVGFSGGQKSIEKTLGIQRGKGIKDMAGEQAPLLWHHYRMGDIQAGKTLVEYNHADVEGMKTIFDVVVERLTDQDANRHALGDPFAALFRKSLKLRKKRVGMLGLSFKPGTDDLRESPMVELVERLIGKGYEVLIYDREVSMARVFGSNKRYIENAIPHVSSLMRDSLCEVINNSEIVVVAKNGAEFAEALERLDADKILLDLVGVVRDRSGLEAQYEGICW